MGQRRAEVDQATVNKENSERYCKHYRHATPITNTSKYAENQEKKKKSYNSHLYIKKRLAVLPQ